MMMQNAACVKHSALCTVMWITLADCTTQSALCSLSGMTLDMSRERETRPGAWVRAARKAVGKSQADLVEVTGSHRTTVYRWERVDSSVDLVTWLGILHALGLPADWQPPVDGDPVDGDDRPH